MARKKSTIPLFHLAVIIVLILWLLVAQLHGCQRILEIIHQWAK